MDSINNFELKRKEEKHPRNETVVVVEEELKRIQADPNSPSNSDFELCNNSSPA